MLLWAAVCLLLAGVVVALAAVVGPPRGWGPASVAVLAVLIGFHGGVLLWLGLAMVRARLVADRAGLHVRGAVLTRHLPWPVSPAELVVVTIGGRRASSAVRLQPLDGSRPTWLSALSRPAAGATGRVRLTVPRGPGEPGDRGGGPEPTAEEEAEALWAWGVEHGCVAPGFPGQGGVVPR